MRRNRIVVQALQSLAIGFTLIGAMPAHSQATELKYWRWVDVWPWGDCQYQCTDLSNDRCDCFR